MMNKFNNFYPLHFRSNKVTAMNINQISQEQFSLGINLSSIKSRVITPIDILPL